MRIRLLTLSIAVTLSIVIYIMIPDINSYRAEAKEAKQEAQITRSFSSEHDLLKILWRLGIRSSLYEEYSHVTAFGGIKSGNITYVFSYKEPKERTYTDGPVAIYENLFEKGKILIITVGDDQIQEIKIDKIEGNFGYLWRRRNNLNVTFKITRGEKE